MTIIVPYRNRQNQLQVFLKHMAAYLPQAAIVVIEQAEGKPFNRAALLNAAYLETLPDHFTAHDVDHLPLSVDYTPTHGVTQLASSVIQTHGFLGAVTMYDYTTFERAGGYHNDYYSRGEDNECAHNLARLSIPVTERFGVFDLQPHPRTGPEFIPWLWAKSKQRRVVQDQLGQCKYKVISHTEKDYTHIKVEL